MAADAPSQYEDGGEEGEAVLAQHEVNVEEEQRNEEI